MKPSAIMNYTKEGYIDYSNIEVSELPWYGPFEFEKIDWKSIASFIHRNQHYVFIASVIYLLLIFGIQRFMKNRQGFNLKKQLFLWNAGLGIFSIAGFIRTSPGLVDQILKPDGFYTSICIINGGSSAEAFWGVAFMISKYVELGDTIFILLLSRKLQLIQWYHHIITLVAVWIVIPYTEPIIRYYMVMNYGVHSLMYPYFALRTLNIRIPKPIANTITTLQLAQMLMGLFVNSYSAILYHSGSPCYRHPTSIKLFCLVYGSFVILFGQLFWNLVVQKTAKHKKE